MRYLLSVLLAALLLCGCAASPAPTEITQPAATLPAVVLLPEETTLPPDPLDVLLADMTLEQKMGQLFIVSPEQLLPETGPITTVSDDLEAALSRYPVGGIILFADNILSPDQVEALNRGLRQACPVGPFLAVDEEGGLVARLAKNDVFHLPRYASAAAVGASGNRSDALAMGLTIGGYLKDNGFNLNFAPVADVNTNPSNPVIGTRAFSSDPSTATAMAEAFARGLREQGVIATFKHFPGHGDTAQDSHSGLAVVYRTKEALEACEFLPFLAAGASDMVMVGHIALPDVTGDMTPAALSHQIVTGILKEQLMFSGLVITDAMNMGAITEACSPGDAAVGALLAGCDIILMPESLPEAFDAVLAGLEDGTLSRQWLDNTVRRILEFKQFHGIL